MQERSSRETVCRPSWPRTGMVHECYSNPSGDYTNTQVFGVESAGRLVPMPGHPTCDACDSRDRDGWVNNASD